MSDSGTYCPNYKLNIICFFSLTWWCSS